MSTQTQIMTRRILARMFMVVFLFPPLPMIILGDGRWWEAWTYALISILGFVLSRLLAAQRHPDILEERARSIDLQDAKPWDKILAPMMALGSLVILINKFFSGVVRIQKDRDHRVVSAGTYHFMRHPGYAGALWAYLAIPLWLESAWALIPAFLLGAVLVLRTALEDQTLQEELPGYKEFAQETRYRVIPGIW